jgi:hypothetical protein
LVHSGIQIVLVFPAWFRSNLQSRKIYGPVVKRLCST